MTSDLIKQVKQKKQDLEQAKLERTLVNQRVSRIEVELGMLEARLKFEQLEPTVSDHALVRYLERCLGYDIFEIKQNLLKDVKEAINAGATRITKNGVTWVVKDKVVVTATD